MAGVLALGAVLALVGSSGLTACLDATQLRVLVSGDGALCSGRPKYVLRVVASPSELELPSGDLNAGVPFPSCSSASGAAAELGDVTVVPRSSSDRSKSLVIELAVGLGGQDPTTCSQASAKGNANCYVARRRVAFKPHTLLTVPIYFDERCAGEVCNPSSTCYRGTCVDSSATCTGSDCLTEAERAQGTGIDPNRPLDASTDGTAPGDASSVDASPDGASDGAVVDAGLDAGCNVLASAAARDKSRAICGGASTCCGGTFFPGAPPCVGQDTERLCQSNCDCPSGADCVDVVSTATAYMSAPRAACVMRGCSNNQGYGREGAPGNLCDQGACCQSGVCKSGVICQ